MSTERCDHLVKQLTSLLGAAGGHLRELAVAEANEQYLQGLLDKTNELKAFGEEQDFATVFGGELRGIEEEVADLLAESAFFRKPRGIPDEPDTNANEPPNFSRRQIVWRLGSLDLEHPKCWPDCESGSAVRVLVAQLKSLETFTWGQLDAASVHNHVWETPDPWEDASVRRLELLNLDDQSSWHQIQLNSLGRLYGYRTDHIFNVVWWDRDHEVYVTKKLKKSQR